MVFDVSTIRDLAGFLHPLSLVPASIQALAKCIFAGGSLNVGKVTLFKERL